MPTSGVREETLRWTPAGEACYGGRGGGATSTSQGCPLQQLFGGQAEPHGEPALQTPDLGLRLQDYAGRSTSGLSLPVCGAVCRRLGSPRRLPAAVQAREAVSICVSPSAHRPSGQTLWAAEQTQPTLCLLPFLGFNFIFC